MRLTKRDIDKANKRRKYADGRGLFLSVSANGRKSWAFVYRFPDAAARGGYREREMGLGSIDDVSLDHARDRAVELRRLVREGIDPLEDRQRAARQIVRNQRDGATFKEVAERYIETKKAEWDEGGKSEQSWLGSLKHHVFPIIGETRIDRIDRADIIDLMRPIWKPRSDGGRPVTAGKLLPRLDMIFEEAIESGLRPLPNPADRASVKKSLPNLKKIHTPTKQKSMPYPEVPGFITALRQREGIAPKALEFLIHTGLRTKEVIGATWDEIDFENAMWTIPAKRMKISRKGSGEAREDHRVPLSHRAIEILQMLPREEKNPHVFISFTKRGKGLSDMAMLKLLKEDMGYAGKYVVHGFRSSFRTWVAEQTTYPGELAEVAIAHYPSDETVSAYLRTDFFERRKPMMDDWAAFVGGSEEMTLPPWKASGPEDRAALTRFIIDELDRQDEVQAEIATRDPRAIAYVATVIDATALAAKIGARVTLAAPPVKPGRKPADPADDKFPAFDRAALDVPRIRALFRLHWGKRNRTEPPMAEHIAAERWGLSADEANQLADKFRKTPLSR